MTEAEEHKSERALATIRKIMELKPIEGADKIEAARVDDWWVVVKKGEFQVSDLAVYFEIDSFLPVRPEFEFLRKSSFRKNWDGREGFRLKTIRLRGQISQGLLLPLDAVMHNAPDRKLFDDPIGFLQVGDNLTGLLGVTKWEKPLHRSLAGVARGNFPSFIPKTDENRIQNLSRKMEEMQACKRWYVREKLDGSSMTVYLKDGVFGVCSRNLDLKETEGNAFWEFARRAELEERLREAEDIDMAIQGELIGPGIQGNKYGLKQTRMYAFGLYDIKAQRYLHDADMEECAEFLGLGVVPLISIVDELPIVKDIVEMANGTSAFCDTLREGCVWRHYKPDGDFSLVHSFKAISNLFLMGEID